MRNLSGSGRLQRGGCLAGVALQSSAGRPAVRTRWLVILPSLASEASAWSSWAVVGLRWCRSRSWVRVSPPGSVCVSAAWICWASGSPAVRSSAQVAERFA